MNIDNYDSLVKAVEDAQANSTEKTLALKSINTNVDCADPDVVNTLSTFKEALSATRDSLKAYKTALKDLISAVRQAAQENG